MRRFLLCLLLLSPLPAVAVAQKKDKDKPKDQPKVILAQPFGLVPGKTTKLVLRGLKLDAAKVVRIAKGSVKLLKKDKAAVPKDLEAGRVGDSIVDVEVTLPADVAGEDVELTVVTETVDAKATHKLLIDRTPPLAEKEPNDGFAQAQPVTLGQTIDGGIGRAQDVDTYRFEAKAGDKVVIETSAARLGSALDSFLTLYDADRQIVASNDDFDGGTDSRIEATLGKGGTYYVSVSDAHDQGGSLHPYRLRVTRK